MHYYQFNIGDYRRDTQHFSMMEHGAYRQLLDWMYLEEVPIPKETEVVMRRLCARTEEEKESVLVVLKEMFELTENGYIQTRCMGEIALYHSKADRARDNGKLGGRPKKTDEVISGLSKKTQTKANAVTKEPINHKPKDQHLLSPPAEKPPKADPIPYQKILDLYHQELPELPRCLVMTSKRKGQIGARWKSGQLPDLDTWGKYFRFIRKSDWLMGKCEPAPGRKRFSAEIEWVTNETNFTKIWEGKYHGTV